MRDQLAASGPLRARPQLRDGEECMASLSAHRASLLGQLEKSDAGNVSHRRIRRARAFAT